MSKYYCEVCKYECKYYSLWIQHKNTIKHNNNGKTVRENKNFCNKSCTKCNYCAKHNEGLRLHYLTKHSNEEEKEKEFTYFCKYCNFGTFKKLLFDLHINTNKHKLIEKQIKIIKFDNNT